MLRRNLIFFLLLCTFLVPVTAQETEPVVEEIEEKPVEVSASHPFSESVKALDEALKTEQYSQALYHLDTLSTKVREQHAQGIRAFFPKEVSGLQSSSWKSSAGDVGFDSAQYVVFSSQLVDDEDNSIEFHVISEDPSILEYSALVKKPRLVKALQDTKVVSISSFKALEKANEENNFLEHNIVISEDLMLNVFINGKLEDDVIAAFYDAIDFEGLLNYIKE